MLWNCNYSLFGRTERKLLRHIFLWSIRKLRLIGNILSDELTSLKDVTLDNFEITICDHDPLEASGLFFGYN